MRKPKPSIPGAKPWRRRGHAAMLCGALAGGFGMPQARAAIWDGKDKSGIEITLEEGSAPELQKQVENIRDLLEDAPAGDSAEISYLRYRFGQNAAYLKKALEAQGYYEVTVEGRLEEETRIQHFHVAPGLRYAFGKVTLHGNDPLAGTRKEVAFPPLEALKTMPGAPAITTTVLEDEAAIAAWMSDNNCLFSYDVTHSAVLDTIKKELPVDFQVTAGKEARFGPIRFEGQESIAQDFLERSLPMKEGECFRRGQVNEARLALQKTGLLAAIDPEIAPQPLPDGSVPVTFRVKERAMRTIKAGANYSTDIGPGVSAGWQHRNLFSRGEVFNADLLLTPIQRKLETRLQKPTFLRPDQKLNLSAVLDQQETDAYSSNGLTLSAGIERALQDGVTAGLGVKYGITRVKDQDATEDVALFSVPMFLAQDKRNDVLDATKGWLVRLDTTPFIDTLDPSSVFYKNKLGGNFYHTFDTAGKPVLALRAVAGSIAGVETEAVPATERFYAGGANSIRGYGYQLVGPLNASNDPVGGRSLIETSAELRLRFKEDYGAALFIDGGNAYDTALPDLSEGLRFGAGLGLRYYTSFGPLRADIAFPLDKRRGVDAPFQLYFSIGQAF